jgi:NAD(P)-dependent dehydrogenase (short-subunit alcohol dehydrogenase family)
MKQYILLTGGHSGLGLGVTKKLLTPGNKLGLIIRNESRKQDFLSELNDFPQDLVSDIDFFFADLSDQEQVRSVSKEIKEEWERIDRLFNNAAIVGSGNRPSKQGNELHLEINTLAPWILTQELKPLLLKSPDAKVITTVTGGMAKRKLDTGLFFKNGSTGTKSAYMQSKQAVMLLMNDLAADESWEGVKFSSVDPGPNKTKMTQGGETPWIIRNVLSRFFNDPEIGTQRIYDAGFGERFSDVNGVYITGGKVVPVKHGIPTHDKKALMASIVD